jgi:hypothetical protein
MSCSSDKEATEVSELGCWSLEVPAESAGFGELRITGECARVAAVRTERRGRPMGALLVALLLPRAIQSALYKTVGRAGCLLASSASNQYVFSDRLGFFSKFGVGIALDEITRLVEFQCFRRHCLVIVVT